MKKLSTLIIGALIAGAPALHAQLSTRTGAEGQYPFGTRPVAGTKMLTLNFNLQTESDDDSTSSFGDNMYKRLGLGDGRLFRAKYFLSSNLAVRGAINITRDSKVSKGDIDTTGSYSGGAIGNDLRSIDRSFLLVPGLEYHFAYTNFFDVYAGSDVILGRGAQVSRNYQEFSGDAYNRMQMKTPYTAFGLNPFVGANIFLANLPLSIGIEYGITAAWKFGDKTKVTSETKTAGGTETSREYFTQEKDPFDNVDSNEYSKLSKRHGVINTVDNFRITLNLYFD